jgi:hypothetical protein
LYTGRLEAAERPALRDSAAAGAGAAVQSGVSGVQIKRDAATPNATLYY